MRVPFNPRIASRFALVSGLLTLSCARDAALPTEATRQGGESAESFNPATAALSTTSTAVTAIAAGDIASCSSKYRDEATAKIVAGISGTVITMGDHAYPDGTATNFKDSYAPTWGKFKDRTRPSPGNHDYHVSGAAAYFDYFGTRHLRVDQAEQRRPLRGARRAQAFAGERELQLAFHPDEHHNRLR